jgi:putative glutamine amidotransferase
MKTFAKYVLFFFLGLIVESGFSQNFLETEFKPGKTYILLAHPTVQNLETIKFLVDHQIFRAHNADFVGVFSADEKYDYSQSVNLLEKPEMQKFHLQKVTGNVALADIYKQNEWSKQFKQLFDCSAGIFFFGGPDMQPEVYGRKNSYSEVTDPNRHLFELSFLFHLLGGSQNKDFISFLHFRPEYFVTGFCLGLQSMNVAAGGTLTQDIPAETYHLKSVEDILKLKKDELHRNYWPEISKDSLLMGINFHHIVYTADPFFWKKVNAKKIPEPLVLSAHHQSIDDLGKDLIVTATSLDGLVIEGIHHRLYPNVFAVQFHPEVPDLYREGKKLKFAPTDTPKSYYEIIGDENRAFHLKYWETISQAIKASIRERKMK